MRALILLPTLVLAASCAAPRDRTESSTTDSTAAAVADSTELPVNRDTIPDSAGAVTSPSGTLRPATGDPTSGITVTTSSAALRDSGAKRDSVPRRDSIIGRDSAFGARYTIDSTGKLVPIRRP